VRHVGSQHAAVRSDITQAIVCVQEAMSVYLSQHALKQVNAYVFILSDVSV
jgi:hypothetical protein